MFITWVMSFFTQFVENYYNYSNESYDKLDSFHNTFFFMMTTLSTVGYASNIKSPVGRISIIIFIAVVVVIVPDECSRLVHLINSKSVYARRKYKKIDKVPFIVLIGTVSPTSLSNFLEEYFHKDHGDDITRHCVLMQPFGPEKIPELHAILCKSKYLINLQYLEGSPLENDSLERCLIEKADAVIILSDKFSFDADQQDTHTILEAMIIKKYLNKMKQKDYST